MDASTEPTVSEPAADPIADLPAASEADFASTIDNSLAKAFDALESATDLEAATPVENAETAPEDQPAEEPVVEEPIEELTEDIGDDWTPKASSAFVRVKGQLKEAREAMEPLQQYKVEAEARIKELEGLAEGKSTEELQAKLKQYEDQQMFSDLEATPAYQEAVTAPLDALINQTKEMADKYEVDPRALIDIVNMTDEATQEEQLSELIPNLSTRDSAKIYGIAEKIDPIAQRRQELLQNKDQALAEAKQLEEQKELQAAADRATVRQNVTRNVIERVQQKLPFLEGMEGLDIEGIQESVSAADPTTLHPVDHAYHSVSAKILPPLVRAHLSLQKEFDTIAARLAEYEEAEPTGSNSSAPAASQGSPAGSFEDRVSAQLSSL
jgi:hypothetical protein